MNMSKVNAITDRIRFICNDNLLHYAFFCLDNINFSC